MWSSATDAFKGMQVGFHFFNIQVRRKSPQPFFVQLIEGMQELLLLAKKDNPDIEEFFPLHPGYYTDNGVLK
jgi:hypothetical protein